MRPSLTAILLVSIMTLPLGAADTPATHPSATAATHPSAAAAAPRPAAPVNLHRPMKPGQIYDVHFIYEKKSDYKRTDRPQAPDPMNKLTQIDLTGQISKIIPDENHDPRQFTLAISHLLSQGRDSIRPGTLLTVTITDQKITFDDPTGSPVPDNAKPLLNSVINAYYAGTQLNNALGSAKPQPLGTPWKLDPTPLAAFLSDDTPVAFKPFNLKGTARLSKEPGPTPGAFRLTASVNCSDFTFEQAGKGMIAEGSTGTYHYSALVPADAESPLPEETRTFDAFTNYTTATDRVKVQWTLHRTLKTTITPVKPSLSGTASAAENSDPANAR